MKVKATEPTAIGIKPKDGVYQGKWGGYVVMFDTGKYAFLAKTETGVRGIDIPVTVTVKNGEISVEVN